ncbi:glycoside hydrolase [Apiospora phragmitis]|uniref:Glycoside hydrolase n=1 Tax=Apiospora phragmitis TaxID=2905665 RepID=A0ABR1TD90_9PEZI
MVYADPSSAYMQLVQPFVEKQEQLGIDFWGGGHRQQERCRWQRPHQIHGRPARDAGELEELAPSG